MFRFSRFLSYIEKHQEPEALLQLCEKDCNCHNIGTVLRGYTSWPVIHPDMLRNPKVRVREVVSMLFQTAFTWASGLPPFIRFKGIIKKKKKNPQKTMLLQLFLVEGLFLFPLQNVISITNCMNGAHS